MRGDHRGPGTPTFVAFVASVAVLGTACVDRDASSGDTDDGTGAGSSSSGPVVADVTGMPPEPGTADATGSPPPPPQTSGSTSGLDDDTSASTGEIGCEDECPTRMLDVLFVVDNSRGMAAAQRRLAQGASTLLGELAALEAASGLLLDLHLAVTTTDNGNPLCTPFQPPGYVPAAGAPVGTACTERLDDFADLAGGPAMPQVCTDLCPVGVQPSAPYVAVADGEDNVPSGTVLEALQCLLPQGFVGCGYEAPLETMLQALNPSAAWNFGADPFLRNGADLALVILTNESDCSVQDYSIMQDPSLMEINPGTGVPSPSSAICWNAGVSCNGPDAMGWYSDCAPVDGLGLHDVDRYTGYLLDELAVGQGKQVMMLALLGVPPVTSHSASPPYEPLAGGVPDLVVRDWIDGAFPMGDILPEEWAMGVTAEDKHFQYGVGPGCTALDTQGQPPSRILAVCDALDSQGGPHCCVESVCDGDYAGALTCLRGLVEITAPN